MNVTPSPAIPAGVLWALAAGLCWGLAFVAPLLLPTHSTLEIVAGRYVAFGLFSLLALATNTVQSRPTTGLGEARVWGRAFGLSLVGNLIYFAALAAAVPRAGAPIVTLIVGILPVTLALAGTLENRSLPRRSNGLPMALIGTGLGLVHFGEAGPAAIFAAPNQTYWTGIALAVVALASWTWYGVANAQTLAARPDISAATQASLQGVTLLPVALPILAVSIMAGATHGGQNGDAFARFVTVCVLLGIATSWIATWCWNRAGQLLPSALAGQLIVFETLAGVVYSYAWRVAVPPALVIAGTAVLIGGVVVAIRRFSDHAGQKKTPAV